MANSSAEELSLASYIRMSEGMQRSLDFVFWAQSTTKIETMNPVVKFAVAVLVDDDVLRHRWKLL